MSRGKKKLVILTPGFPENEEDTTCLPMQQSFVKTLKELSPELDIIVLSFQYPYFKKKYEWFDIEVISFDGRNKGGLKKLLLRKKLYRTLKAIHHSSGISCLLSFWYGECARIGKKFTGKYAINHYCWILGQDARKENNYPRQTPPKASELIALSDFLQDEFEKSHGTRPMHVIPAAIDPKQFSDAIKERDIDILGAGSLIPLKQYDIFIEAVAEIKKKFPSVKATLIGEGPEKGKLWALITEYKLESNITLTGELSYAEVLFLMQRAKIFLHPSSYEGFSGVCLEALYAGNHVISFCKAMNREIEQWHVVSSREEMIQKAIALLENPSPVYQKILFAAMEDTVKKMKTLFSKSR